MAMRAKGELAWRRGRPGRRARVRAMQGVNSTYTTAKAACSCFKKKNYLTALQYNEIAKLPCLPWHDAARPNAA